MNKHTKGPWIQAAYSPTDVIACGKTMIAMTREGLNGISRDEAIANAQLIAAAPDLLNSLQQIERLGRQADGNLVDVRAMLVDIAQAAIAKAKGMQV